MKPQLHIYNSIPELTAELGVFIKDLAQDAVAARGRFTVALSGGSMPKVLASALTHEPIYSQIDWTQWHVCWADERIVPLDHPDSNYYLAQQHLFQQVDIPQSQIYPIDDALDAASAATAYQEMLAHLFQTRDAAWPAFDLILLGMGEDGHTASLFPNHPLLQNQTDWVAPILDSPKPPPERITLTLPLINKARQVLFIVTGAGKAEILPQIFTPTDPLNPLPAAQIQPKNGQLYWFLDHEAAKRLPSKNSKVSTS